MNSEIIARLELSFPLAVDYEDHENDKVYFLMEQLRGIHERVKQLTQDAEYIQSSLLKEIGKGRG